MSTHNRRIQDRAETRTITVVLGSIVERTRLIENNVKTAQVESVWWMSSWRRISEHPFLYPHTKLSGCASSPSLIHSHIRPSSTISPGTVPLLNFGDWLDWNSASIIFPLSTSPTNVLSRHNPSSPSPWIRQSWLECSRACGLVCAYCLFSFFWSYCNFFPHSRWGLLRC